MSRISCVRSTTRALSASSSVRCCVGRQLLVDDAAPPPTRPRTTCLQLRELALPDERTRIRVTRGAGRARRPERRRPCARAPGARRAPPRRRHPSGTRRRRIRAPAPPRVRDRAGARSREDYAAVRCPRDRARRPPRRADARARRHPVREPAASTRSASTSCALVPPSLGSPTTAGDEAFLFLPRPPARRRRSSSSRATTTPCPRRETFPGRIADGAVHGLGASDMKGGLAVALELVRDLSERAPGPSTSGSLLFGREELAAGAQSAPCALRRLERRFTRRPSRSSSSRPTDGSRPGCLGNVVARLIFRGTSGHSARPWLADNAIERAVDGPRARCSSSTRDRCVVGGPRVHGGRVRDAARGRDRRQRHPRRGDAPPSTSGTRRTARRRRPRHTFASSCPNGAILEIVEQRPARPRRRTARRSCASLRAAGRLERRAEAGVDERRGLHGERDRRRELRPGPHGVRAPQDELVRIDRARACVRGAPPRSSAARVARRCRVMDADRRDRRALGAAASSIRGRSRRRSRCSTAARPGSPRSATDRWVVNEWTKKAILLYFRLRKVEPMEVGGLHFLDKIPVKADYAERGVRVVPPGVARYGSFLSEGVVLMPGYVNIGAWVGPRTMVDTWATVGSCAQIGADVHLSGGVGIGGVLEPPQARPGHRRGRRLPRLARGRRRGSRRRRGGGDRPERRPLRVDPRSST